MQIMRIAEVCKATGLARSTVYFFIEQGTFPKPVKLGEKISGWVREEVENWIKARIDQRDASLTEAA